MNLCQNCDEFGGIAVKMLKFGFFSLRVGFGCGRTKPSNPSGKTEYVLLLGFSRNQPVNHIFRDLYLAFTVIRVQLEIALIKEVLMGLCPSIFSYLYKLGLNHYTLPADRKT